MKDNYPKLNLPACRLKVRRETDGGISTWDALRGMWCRLTPEEWVRRHVVQYLTGILNVPSSLIRQEHPVCIEGMNQRADIVVYGPGGHPKLLVECKAPGVPVDASVYAQAVRYNTVIVAEYIMITNGLEHFVYKNNEDSGYEKLDSVPELF